MNKHECAELIAALSSDGEKLVKAHMHDYDGKILLHVLAADHITIPLMEEMKRPEHDKTIIQRYCHAIEEMWKIGDEDVQNVVEVTILERLTDEPEIWSCFGSYLSKEFKRFINTEYLKQNQWLGDIQPLKY